MLPSVRRRTFVSAIALLAASRAVGFDFASDAYAADGLDADGFLALSKKLIGQDDLDADFAGKILKSFDDGGMGADLAKLAAGGAADAKSKIANEVVAAWYTGVSPDGKAVTDFNAALMWPAMSYTKPWANCGDGYGYWGEAPEAP